MKNFLNEELVRVSNKLKEASLVEVIKQDEVMIEKTNKLITKLESYRGIPPSEEVISTVLKTQQIVKDIFEDGSYN